MCIPELDCIHTHVFFILNSFFFNRGGFKPFVRMIGNAVNEVSYVDNVRVKALSTSAIASASRQHSMNMGEIDRLAGHPQAAQPR